MVIILSSPDYDCAIHYFGVYKTKIRKEELRKLRLCALRLVMTLHFLKAPQHMSVNVCCT